MTLTEPSLDELPGAVDLHIFFECILSINSRKQKILYQPFIFVWIVVIWVDYNDLLGGYKAGFLRFHFDY